MLIRKSFLKGSRAKNHAIFGAEKHRIAPRVAAPFRGH
jgi:hypothetical protein